MSLTTAALEVLVAKGLSASDILDVSRALDVRADPTAAERKRRQREREAEKRDMSQRDVTRDALPSLDKETSPRPPKEINLTPADTHSARKAWPVPDGVEPRHWSDFLANRKRKRLVNSQTALDGVMRDLAEKADDDWPPGKLVEHAAAKGWGSINYPSDEPRNGSRHEPVRSNRRPTPRSNDGFGSALREAAGYYSTDFGR